MKISTALLNIFLLLMMSCGGDAPDPESTNNASAQSKQKITEKTIDGLEYTDFVLSNEAEQEVSGWEKYQELAIQISYLKKADLSFFNGDRKLLNDFIIEFKAGLPEKLNTNPIQSRLTILETKILKLHDNLILSNIDLKLQLESIKEVLEAFSNLNYRIDKKLEFDIYNEISPE